MILTSISLVLAASTLAAPFSSPIHFHPRVKVQDDRVAFMLSNDNSAFRDVKIAGHIYTLERHKTLEVKAPVGTIVYVDTPTRTHKRGDVLLEVTPAQNKTRIALD